jgi:hypothetical protein
LSAAFFEAQLVNAKPIARAIAKMVKIFFIILSS